MANDPKVPMRDGDEAYEEDIAMRENSLEGEEDIPQRDDSEIHRPGVE